MWRSDPVPVTNNTILVSYRCDEDVKSVLGETIIMFNEHRVYLYIRTDERNRYRLIALYYYIMHYSVNIMYVLPNYLVYTDKL